MWRSEVYSHKFQIQIFLDCKYLNFLSLTTFLEINKNQKTKNNNKKSFVELIVLIESIKIDDWMNHFVNLITKLYPARYGKPF